MIVSEWSSDTRFVLSPHAVLRWRQGQPKLSSGSMPTTLTLHPDAVQFLSALAKPLTLSELQELPLRIPRGERYALLRVLVSAGAVDALPDAPPRRSGVWWDPYDRAQAEATVLQLIQIAHGFTNSARHGFCVDDDGKPMPWLSRPAIDFLLQLDLADARIFEYGGGASTYYWARQCCSVTCVESNPRWFRQLRNDLNDSVTLLLRRRPEEFSRAILETNVEYDIILIDATPEYRSGCVGPAIDRLAERGMILLDDAPFYKEAAAQLRAAGLIEVDLTGYCPLEANLQTTALFLKRNFAMPRKEAGGPAFPFGSPGFRWNR